MVALGLGLATLATVALIEVNISAQLRGTLPPNAPSYFFIDIQNTQLDRFSAIVHAQPGVSGLREVPSMRARIVALKGVPVDRAQVSDDTRWALRGDRGLTPWLVLGTNALTAYILSELLAIVLSAVTLTRGETLQQFLYRSLPAFGPPPLVSVTYSVLFVLVCLLPVVYLYRHRIFLKL